MGNAIDQPTHGKVVLSDSRLGIVRDTPVGRIKYSDSGQLPIASPEAECAMNRHSEKILGLKLKHPPPPSWGQKAPTESIYRTLNKHPGILKAPRPLILASSG